MKGIAVILKPVNILFTFETEDERDIFWDDFKSLREEYKMYKIEGTENDITIDTGDICVCHSRRFQKKIEKEFKRGFDVRNMKRKTPNEQTTDNLNPHN